MKRTLKTAPNLKSKVKYLILGDNGLPYNRNTARKRWTVEMMKVYRRFIGWEAMLNLVNAVDIGLRGPRGELLIHDAEECNEGRGLIATVFEAGTRICESLGQEEASTIGGLRPCDFTQLSDRVNVIFSIEKRYKKKGKATKFKATDDTKMRWNSEDLAKSSGHPYESYNGYNTVREIDIRNVTIPWKEPLAPLMIDWVQKVKETKGEKAKLFKVNYNKAYRIITQAGERIGEHFPPHRLRAERATQLALEYGLDDHELTEWFSWKNSKEAHNYTTLAPRTIEKMFR